MQKSPSYKLRKGRPSLHNNFLQNAPLIIKHLHISHINFLFTLSTYIIIRCHLTLCYETIKRRRNEIYHQTTRSGRCPALSPVCFLLFPGRREGHPPLHDFGVCQTEQDGRADCALWRHRTEESSVCGGRMSTLHRDVFLLDKSFGSQGEETPLSIDVRGLRLAYRLYGCKGCEAVVPVEA